MEDLLTIREAASLLQSFGIECHWHNVKKWAVEGKIKAIHDNRVYRIDQNDVYEFLELLWKGTSYEIGIDDETKISRLVEESESFIKRIAQLKQENKEFEVKHF